MKEVENIKRLQGVIRQLDQWVSEAANDVTGCTPAVHEKQRHTPDFQVELPGSGF